MNAVPRIAYSAPTAHPISIQSGRKRRALELICVLAVYVAAGKIGLAVPFTSGNVSPLWPPAGVALAAILTFGYGIWPAIALGAFTVNFFSAIPHLASVGIAFGNTVGPLCAAWLLWRLLDFRPSLKHLKDVLGLCTLGAFCGTAVSATFGVSSLLLAGVRPWSGFRTAWLMWWWGDGLGVLVIAPVVLTFASLIRIRGERRVIELVCMLLGALAGAFLIFDRRFASMRSDTFVFVLFPFVLWGAIRFETAGAAIVSCIVSGVAAWGTAHGFGPFMRGSALQSATLLQSFLAVTSVSGIVLAATVAERGQLIREQSTREALEKSENNYRIIVETACEGIWKIDSDFVTTFVNRRMAEMLGYGLEEMLARHLFDFLFDGDIGQKQAELQRRRQGISEQVETRYRRKDGSVLWARVSSSPIIGDDGSFKGAFAMVSDITEEKQNEAEEKRSRQVISLLSEAVQQTADSVVITDSQGRIEYVNPAFEVTTGYARSEAVGNTPRILKSNLHDKDFYARMWSQILQGEPFRGTLVNRKKSGELFWAEQTITPIKDSFGTTTHFVSVLKDITELRKRQEHELQLRLARQVQQRFYAGATISVAGFDIASSAHPAEETGGDYLDMFSMPDGRICIGIGDVSGHGLSSALLMALTRAYVRSFVRMESDLATILSNVNHMLLSDLENNRFVTLLLVALDWRNNRLSFANAGHPSGFLMNGSGDIDCVLESSGLPLGLFADSQFVTSSVPLTQSQVMVLLTDGITEMNTPNDACFGFDGVFEHVRGHKEHSARDLAEGIYLAARAFAGDNPQQDDATDIVVKFA